jgi:hypothetical protein
MPHQAKETWIDVHTMTFKDSLVFLAVDPTNPHVPQQTPGPDDLAGLPAVQAEVDGRDFLTWQRGYEPEVDIAMETIVVAHEGLE